MNTKINYYIHIKYIYIQSHSLEVSLDNDNEGVRERNMVDNPTFWANL